MKDDKDLLIKKLRIQVSLMREIIHILDKDLSCIVRRSTPHLPSIVFEDVE